MKSFTEIIAESEKMIEETNIRLKEIKELKIKISNMISHCIYGKAGK